MKLNDYPETNSHYIDLIDAPSVESEEFRPGIVLDFDAKGQLIGIDVQNASQHTDLTQLDIADLPAKIIAKRRRLPKHRGLSFFLLPFPD